jgi:hypothetical protein
MNPLPNLLRRSPSVLALALFPLAWPLAVHAAEPIDKPPEEKRVIAGKSYAPAGSLLAREAPGKAWKLIDSLDPVYTRDHLVVLPGGKAVIGSKNGAVRLSMVGNLPQFYPIPSFESRVTLHENAGFDLDLTLDRGGIKITNRKEKDSARVRIRFAEGTWDLTLTEPGDEVVLQRHGFWLAGIPFSTDDKSTDKPATASVLVVLKGNVAMKTGAEEFAMSAPPGSAVYQWESERPAPDAPQRMEKLPDWLQPGAAKPTELDRARKIVDGLADGIKRTSAEEALAALLAKAAKETDKDLASDERQIAIYSMGAIDDLGHLIAALGDNSAEVRELAVSALRHWIGAGPREDKELYQFLVKQKEFSAAQAEIAMQLLHSFGDTALSQKETFETLIAYLRHDKLAIRELAWWHLVRIYPDGKKISYNPGADAAERNKGVQEWQKLLDDGKLPRTNKPGEK